MPWIEYRGCHDAVDVPDHQLGAVKARTPVEVPADVAEALTAGGVSETWFEVDAPAVPVVDGLEG